MKDLIVFYSLEGNTRYAAERIRDRVGADMLSLVPKKEIKSKGFAKFIWGGKSAIMGEKPELEKYDVDLGEYDRIIFGFPVWASNFTPPIRTFINDNLEAIREKRFAAFACQSGNGAEKALQKLAGCLGDIEFEQTAVFIDPKARKSKETDERIDSFCESLKDDRY